MPRKGQKQCALEADTLRDAGSAAERDWLSDPTEAQCPENKAQESELSDGSAKKEEEDREEKEEDRDVRRVR
jgi:hypothetical protein